MIVMDREILAFSVVVALFSNTLVIQAAGHQARNSAGWGTSQFHRIVDEDDDPRYSNVFAAKEGLRFYTNTPERGLTETLTVTQADGLYVGEEKVATMSEHRVVLNELQNTQAEIQGLRSEFQALRELLQTSLAVEACERPPSCPLPGGKLVQHNSTSWRCVCESGWSGESCEEIDTTFEAPHIVNDLSPIANRHDAVAPSQSLLATRSSRLGGCASSHNATCGLRKLVENESLASDREFGSALAISSKYLVALGGSSSQPEEKLTVYSVKPNGSTTLLQHIPATQGFSDMVLSEDFFVYSSVDDDQRGLDAGAVYVYQVVDGQAAPFVYLTTLHATDNSNGKFFGSLLAMSSAHLVVGCQRCLPGRGAVYIWSLQAGQQPVFLQKLFQDNARTNHDYGTRGIALSTSILAVGATGANVEGRVFMYRLSQQGLFALTGQEIAGAYTAACLWPVDFCGDRLILWDQCGGSGNTAWNQRKMYIYTLSEDGTATLNNTIVNENVFWGTSQKRSSGSYGCTSSYFAVKGSESSVSGSSAVHLYEFVGNTLQLIQKVFPRDQYKDDQFGKAVAVTDSRIAIGAPGAHLGFGYAWDIKYAAGATYVA